MGSGHQALRRGRWSEAGQIYLVTFATSNRRRHFGDWFIASDAARLVVWSSAWLDNRLLAWTLMPDHWHGLIELGDDATLADCVRWLKGRSARALRQKYPALGRVWAPGYHDHAIRREEALLPAARYLVMNPLRAVGKEGASTCNFWGSRYHEKKKKKK